MTTTWQPSAVLANHVRNALVILQRHWPRALALVLDEGADGRAFIADYARAISGANLTAIVPAAERWVVEESLPPRPADLGRLCREISKQQQPPQYGVRPSSGAAIPPIVTNRADEKVQDLGVRAYRQLSSWSLVAETWRLLLAEAADADEREAIRSGTLPLEAFALAVKRVKRGERAPAARSSFLEALGAEEGIS